MYIFTYTHTHRPTHTYAIHTHIYMYILTYCQYDHLCSPMLTLNTFPSSLTALYGSLHPLPCSEPSPAPPVCTRNVVSLVFGPAGCLRYSYNTYYYYTLPISLRRVHIIYPTYNMTRMNIRPRPEYKRKGFSENHQGVSFRSSDLSNCVSNG